jgi:aryl-alcohol dehydrogenase-like predicted oxidoreductase
VGFKAAEGSVSRRNLESAEIAIGDPRYSCIQLPLNLVNRKFSAAVDQASARGMWIATNRPFAMGAMLHGAQPASPEAAFRFVLDHAFTGVILTGTKRKEHLRDNWQAFHSA